MTSSLLTFALLLLPGDEPRKPNDFAPSLNQLTREEEDKLDDTIDRFILQDTGRLTGEAGKKARQEFDKLGPDAIPALIRGLNKAAAIDHSCPAVVIAKKLARMLASSTDSELLQYARENVGAGVTQSRHMGVIKDLRTLSMLRRNEVMRRGLDKEWTFRSLSVKELAELIGKERGEKLKLAVKELGRRRGDDVVAALGAAAASYESDVRTLAREQLRQQLTGLSPAPLHDKLQDDRAEIRAAALRVAGGKGIKWGDDYIKALADDNAEVRDAAHEALLKLNKGKADFGPAKDATETERTAAIAKWREWWQAQSGQ